MIHKLTRTLRIADSQFRNHTFREFVIIVIRALFRVEKILVYVKELNEEIYFPNNKAIYECVEKGELAELETEREKIISPYWEFCCHLHDGVKDFFIYRENGEIGHVSWIYYRDDPNRIINLGKQEGEIKFCLTLPQYRGKGIYPAALVRIQEYLKEKGYRRVFICVKEDNVPSIRGIEKAGFSPISEMKLIKLLGMQVSKRYATNH